MFEMVERASGAATISASAGSVWDMELILAQGCLAVFVDDTGHEAFNGQSVYGLGGCAAMATDLDRLIRTPWREVRSKITGSSDTPLHAATFTQSASKEQMNVIGEFFRAR